MRLEYYYVRLLLQTVQVLLSKVATMKDTSLQPTTAKALMMTGTQEQLFLQQICRKIQACISKFSVF